MLSPVRKFVVINLAKKKNNPKMARKYWQDSSNPKINHGTWVDSEEEATLYSYKAAAAKKQMLDIGSLSSNMVAIDVYKGE